VGVYWGCRGSYAAVTVGPAGLSIRRHRRATPITKPRRTQAKTPHQAPPFHHQHHNIREEIHWQHGGFKMALSGAVRAGRVKEADEGTEEEAHLA